MLSVSEEKGGQVTCAPSTTKRATTDRYETRARFSSLSARKTWASAGTAARQGLGDDDRAEG